MDRGLLPRRVGCRSPLSFSSFASALPRSSLLDPLVAVLADAKFKAKDHFTGIHNSTKARLLAQAKAGGAAPALQRQLSAKTQLLRDLFQKLYVSIAFLSGSLRFLR
jgi:hypothetical protein